MEFKDLAWGAFIWANLNKGTPGYERYERLMSNSEFLERLQGEPSLEEFEELRDFLVHFGVHYAPTTLAKQYLSVWPQLKPHIQLLRGETLATCDLFKSEILDAIQGAFGCLQWPSVWGGDVVASKVLHFFNASLFIMWDSDIQLSYQKFGAKGYLEFLKVMQNHAVEVIRSFEQLSLPGSPAEFLSQHLGYRNTRSLAKFLDDYNWVTITKNWPHAIPSWLESLFIEISLDGGQIQTK
ncbi:hypothetical protein M1N57_00170 [Dehalococcoidales bacterium]|nr:hypothetical protein [Dehalococcoidales bacterium]